MRLTLLLSEVRKLDSGRLVGVLEKAHTAWSQGDRTLSFTRSTGRE